MQSSSILCCCSNFPVKPIEISVSREVFANSLRFWRPTTSVAHSAVRLSATQDFVDATTDSGFVETGYIYRVHGLQGEVKVKPATDFPELRFSKPGTRWLKRQVFGTEILEEIKLVEGRGHPGQNWIVKFEDINTVEQAQKLVGSAILVTDQDRPVLEEGDFYTHDLIGMRVVHQESGEIVGTIANVFNNGASDLLHVELNNSSAHRAWIPFVEAVVPTVNLEKREIVITPPKGLLGLNIPKHEKSKKERRELEWKERKRLQRRLIAAKKKLCEMDQKHVFHGFQCGEKYQKSLLADQIVSLNSRLLQQALGNMKVTPSSRNLFHLSSSVPKSNILRLHDSANLRMEGYNLMSNGKVTLILVFEDAEEIFGNENPSLLFKKLIDGLGFVENAERNSVPLVLVCPSHLISSMEKLFRDHDYLGFDSEKMWFFGEAVLPVVRNSLEEENKHKIVMKTHWEFLQRPIGSGGVIGLFSSHESLLDQLTELGVEYIEVSKIGKTRERTQHHALIGLVSSRGAEFGVCICEDEDPETDFDVVFSMGFFRNVVRRVNEVLRFESVPRDDDGDAAHNSFELRCSVYGCLDFVDPAKVCVFDST